MVDFYQFFVLSLLVSVLIILYSDLLGSKETILKLIYNKPSIEERTECQLEWEQLNEHAFIRIPTVYFFTDLNQLCISIFRHQDFNYQYIFIVTITDNRNTKIEYHLENLQVNQHYLHNSHIETVRASLVLMTTINDSKNFKMTLKVCMKEMQNCTKYPLDVNIRRSKPSESTELKHSIICTEAYYFKKDKMQTFEWWIKINRLSGYNQMIMYNHSLGGEKFNELFLRYKNFVKLNQLQCYPNFYGNQTQIEQKPFVSLGELKKLYNKDIWPGLHTALEGYVFNECFLANRNKYKYISITDQDESIAPRRLLSSTIDLFHLDNQDYKKLIKNYDCYNKEESDSRLETYLSSVITNLNLTNKLASFHFKMSMHLKNVTIDIIFKQLGLFLSTLDETKPLNYSILIEDQNDISEYNQKLKFWFSIRNKSELDYAKRIYKFHTDLIEPILKTNKQLLDQVAAEPFNRVYILFGKSSTDFLWGKTIHNTITTNDFTVHIGGQAITVPVEYGHLSHFRQVYNLHWGIFPITDLMFDFNYYNCYFKPIIKEFGYNLKEF